MLARAIAPRGLAAALIVLALLTGCGGGENADDGGRQPSLNSALLNYDEADFAADPDLRANPDDIITLRLEDPSGGYRDDFDTGDTPGVDVIPYYFHDTMERRICWENDPGAEAVPTNAAPAFMELQNDAGDVIMQVVQDGPCVTGTIAAGEYRAVFHHGASARSDRDLIFILPYDSSTSARPGVLGEPSFEPAPIPDSDPIAPAPFCSYLPWAGTNVVVARVVDTQPGAGCEQLRLFPFEPFQLNGVCTDLSLLKGQCSYVGNPPPFFIGTAAGSYARVYEDLFFRGPRKTIALAIPVPEDLRQAIQDLFVVRGRASLVVVNGSATPNKDILILTGGCDQCNLAGVQLPGADLCGASLHLADLSHANLAGAHLENASAQQTIFKSAHLDRVHLDGADLTGALFDTAGAIDGENGASYPAADLTCATLTKATLSNAWLSGATLDHADLTGAMMAGSSLARVSAVETVFKQATLTPQVDLRNSILTRAVFAKAMMQRAVLTQVIANDADFTQAVMSFANLQGATLSGARMGEVMLDQAVLARDTVRDIEGCKLQRAYLANANLSSADATGVNMSQARFYGKNSKANGAVLTNADLTQAELSGTNFTGATLQNANLDDAHCVNCKFDGAKMAATSGALNDAAKFLRTDLRGASLDQATVSGCDFTDAWISFAMGRYHTGGGADYLYSEQFMQSSLGAVKTLDKVTCPDGLPGPCNSMARLLPARGTPTTGPTQTPRPTNTPLSRCPTETPRH